MKTHARLLTLLLSVVGALRLDAAPPAKLPAWNVVLVTLDAVDARRMGLYGGSPKTTPFLDQLGAKSIVFDQAYCTTGSTGPSHATILSGVLPIRHGVYYNGLPVTGDVPWLPELLQKNGYYTIGSTVAEFMSEREKFERGFSKFACVVDSRGQSSNRFGFSQLVNLLGDDGWKGLPQPFFAWVHLKGGHDPLVPIEPEFLARHSRDLSPDVLPPSLKSGHEGLTPAQLRSSDQWYAYYDANLSEADSTIEALYRSLDRGNRLANTILIITADHGETFDHGIMEEHWLSPWQSTLHVPLIIHAPKRLKAGRVKDRIVSTEDFAPTVLDLLGIAYRDERWAGGSAFAARRRTSLAAESPYSTAYTAALQQSAAKPAAEVRSQIAELKDTGLFYWTWIERSVKGPLYKLIYFDPGRNEGLPQGFQLYDLNRDPMENNDLLRSGQVTRRQARGILARAREKSPFFAVPPEMNRTPRAGTTTLGQPVQGLSPETIEILRSLGYVQ